MFIQRSGYIIRWHAIYQEKLLQLNKHSIFALFSQACDWISSSHSFGVARPSPMQHVSGEIEASRRWTILTTSRPEISRTNGFSRKTWACNWSNKSHRLEELKWKCNPSTYHQDSSWYFQIPNKLWNIRSQLKLLSLNYYCLVNLDDTWQPAQKVTTTHLETMLNSGLCLDRSILPSAIIQFQLHLSDRHGVWEINLGTSLATLPYPSRCC